LFEFFFHTTIDTYLKISQALVLKDILGIPETYTLSSVVIVISVQSNILIAKHA
jgi:hypothetical protein